MNCATFFYPVDSLIKGTLSKYVFFNRCRNASKGPSSNGSFQEDAIRKTRKMSSEDNSKTKKRARVQKSRVIWCPLAIAILFLMNLTQLCRSLSLSAIWNSPVIYWWEWAHLRNICLLVKQTGKHLFHWLMMVGFNRKIKIYWASAAEFY